MMLCRVVLVAIGLGAEAYAPIQMVNHGIKGLAVLPEGFPWNVQDSVTPQNLIISHAVENIPPSRVPYFSARPDQTITCDDMDWCLEADGDKLGAIARVNKCNGGAAQKWNWIPNGQGSNMLQLHNTKMCLDVRDGYSLEGAPIELRDCENSVTETWAFEDVTAGISESAARSSGMRHAMLSLLALAGVGVLGVSAWLMRWNATRDPVAFNMGQGGGVALTAPTRSSNISMTATVDPPKGEEESAPAAAKKTAEPEIVRGSIVRIFRRESYWFQETGTVVTVAKTGDYPVTVRFTKCSYSGITTNNFALRELKFVSGPAPKAKAKSKAKAKARASDTKMQALRGVSDGRLGAPDVRTPIPGRAADGGEPFVHVQGQSLRTWSFPSLQDQVQVLLRTDGRPLDAAVELWHGPDNTPTVMRVYVEDGFVTPFSAVVATPRSPNTVAVRNIGQVEFPLTANVFSAGVDVPTPECLSSAVTVQGGAVRTFAFHPNMDSVQVLLTTDGRPLNARIELLQGPTNEKQIIELYNDDGMERPFFGILNCPGSGSVVRIVNTGPIEFPMSASVVPYS